MSWIDDVVKYLAKNAEESRIIRMAEDAMRTPANIQALDAMRQADYTLGQAQSSNVFNNLRALDELDSAGLRGEIDNLWEQVPITVRMEISDVLNRRGQSIDALDLQSLKNVRDYMRRQKKARDIRRRILGGEMP